MAAKARNYSVDTYNYNPLNKWQSKYLENQTRNVIM